MNASGVLSTNQIVVIGIQGKMASKSVVVEIGFGRLCSHNHRRQRHSEHALGRTFRRLLSLCRKTARYRLGCIPQTSPPFVM